MVAVILLIMYNNHNLNNLENGMSDSVNHPSHYGGKDNPYEAIKIIRHYRLGFNLGNVLKYILRAGKKDPDKELEDLRKAVWYLQKEIEWGEEDRLTKNKVSVNNI